MPPKKKTAAPKSVTALTHGEAKRKNIPTAEHQSVLDEEQKNPKQVRYPRNTDLNPQLVWRGKDEQDWSDLVDDGHGADDLLHLVVEIKGYRREDAKEKKTTMDTYWIPGVNHLGTHGRWAFAEFRDVWEMEADFAAKVEQHFQQMLNITLQAASAK